MGAKVEQREHPDSLEFIDALVCSRTRSQPHSNICATSPPPTPTFSMEHAAEHGRRRSSGAVAGAEGPALRRAYFGLDSWKNDPKIDPTKTFADNSITTSKYTWVTALPLSLFGQFRRVANVYFLIISLLMCIGTYYPTLFTSPLTPWSEWERPGLSLSLSLSTETHHASLSLPACLPHSPCLPASLSLPCPPRRRRRRRRRPTSSQTGTLLTLCFVLGVTMVIDISDDVKRHNSDGVINSRPTLVLGPADFLDVNDIEKEWRDLRVGDIVRVDGKRAVPADLILLSTSEENDVCYVETSNIDGETNLKIKQSVSPELANQTKQSQIGREWWIDLCSLAAPSLLAAFPLFSLLPDPPLFFPPLFSSSLPFPPLPFPSLPSPPLPSPSLFSPPLPSPPLFFPPLPYPTLPRTDRATHRNTVCSKT